MNFQKISAELLKPAAYNPRKELQPGDPEYEKLKRSIDEFGYLEPVVWNITTGNVVGGRQRLSVLLQNGETEIECVVVELDLQREKALNIALNKITGTWDTDKLSALLTDLKASDLDVSLTGFDAEEVDALFNERYSKESVQDSFNIDKEKEDIEVAGETRTMPGDIWLLGNHRLLCGDSTKEKDFILLMDGARAQCVVTSPPYGVGKEYEKVGINPWFETMRPAITNICKHADIICWNIGDLLITGTQFIEPTESYSINLFNENGFRPIWIRIWIKQGMNFGNAPYHLVTNKPVQQYEYVSAFAYQGTEKTSSHEESSGSSYDRQSYKFVKRLSNEENKKWGYAGIWDIATVRANNVHPAMFPVELPWRCIRLHSDRGDIVLDPFAGCGTTLIACEQTARCGYAIEISPVYCDLIVKRWEQFTGKTAVKMEEA